VARNGQSPVKGTFSDFPDYRLKGFPSETAERLFRGEYLYQISEITLGLATSALQQIFRLHSCLAMLAMVTRSRQKICAASLPNPTLFLIFGIIQTPASQVKCFLRASMTCSSSASGVWNFFGRRMFFLSMSLPFCCSAWKESPLNLRSVK